MSAGLMEEQMDGDTPQFRYDARLAGEIQLRWQQRWEREGTFQSPNPAGPLSGGFADEAGGPSSTCWTSSPTPAASGCTSVIRWATSVPTCSAAICA